MFFKEKYGLFADLGNLSKYSFEELKKLTSHHFQFVVVHLN
jgi:hypothetical protein